MLATHTLPGILDAAAAQLRGLRFIQFVVCEAQFLGKTVSPSVFLLSTMNIAGCSLHGTPLLTSWGMRGPAGSSFFRETRTYAETASPHLLMAGWLHSRADASRRGGGSGSWSR